MGKSGHPSQEGLRVISQATSQIWRNLLLNKKERNFELIYCLDKSTYGKENERLKTMRKLFRWNKCTGGQKWHSIIGGILKYRKARLF